MSRRASEALGVPVERRRFELGDTFRAGDRGLGGLADVASVGASVLEATRAGRRGGHRQRRLPRDGRARARAAHHGEKTRGVPALFSRALFQELMSLRGAEGAKRIIKRRSSEALIVAVPEAAFDVDTPEDYRVCKREATDNSEAG